MFMYYIIIILYQCLITFYDVLCVARRKLDVPAMFDVFFLRVSWIGHHHDHYDGGWPISNKRAAGLSTLKSLPRGPVNYWDHG